VERNGREAEQVKKVKQLSKRLYEYLVELTDKNQARELKEQIQSFCKVERIETEGLSQILQEMGRAGRLGSLGRVLAAATGDNTVQRWRDFARVLVKSDTGGALFNRSRSVVPGITQDQMALAMEWMMGSEIGARMIKRAETALSDVSKPCRSLKDVMVRVMAPWRCVRRWHGI
jgi:hypothetical protein